MLYEPLKTLQILKPYTIVYVYENNTYSEFIATQYEHTKIFKENNIQCISMKLKPMHIHNWRIIYESQIISGDAKCFPILPKLVRYLYDIS